MIEHTPITKSLLAAYPGAIDLLRADIGATLPSLALAMGLSERSAELALDEAVREGVALSRSISASGEIWWSTYKLPPEDQRSNMSRAVGGLADDISSIDLRAAALSQFEYDADRNTITVVSIDSDESIRIDNMQAAYELAQRDDVWAGTRLAVLRTALELVADGVWQPWYPERWRIADGDKLGDERDDR